jgi:uncharacterized protein
MRGWKLRWQLFRGLGPVKDDVASPCVNICSLDQSGRWCLGCGRSVDEIAGWLSAGPEQRKAILAELPERLLRLKNKYGLD